MSHYTLPTIIPFASVPAILPCASYGNAPPVISRRAKSPLNQRRHPSQTCLPAMRRGRNLFAPVGSVSYESRAMPGHGAHARGHTLHGTRAANHSARRKLSELGLPPFDIFTARTASRESAYLLPATRPPFSARCPRRRVIQVRKGQTRQLRQSARKWRADSPACRARISRTKSVGPDRGFETVATATSALASPAPCAQAARM